MRNRGFRGSNRGKSRDPLKQFENNTKQVKKCFMYDAIMDALSLPYVKPFFGVFNGVRAQAYLFADLPFGCKAVLFESQVIVAKGVTSTGVIQEMHECVYTMDGNDFLLSNKYQSIWEYHFVSRVKERLQIM